MNKTNISWCDMTWNPITGCKRGCSYCYAKRIHDRFHPCVPFSEIIMHSERFNDPDLRKEKSMTIFVGSMSDPEYWLENEFQKIVDICKEHPQHTFMFLSKNHTSFLKISKWPKNCMQGLTITGSGLDDRINIKMMTSYPRPFLSIEPLTLTIPNLDKGSAHSGYDNFELIIVGAMTGPKAVSIKPEWIQSVKDYCPGYKIHWKPSMKPYLNEV
jgi:protein gp37